MSRQRQVYDGSELVHLWAHQTQPHAHNPQRNFYFDGDIIYSYGSHFPIARHVKNKRGKKAVLFTTSTYSSTTAGHISCVRGSIPPEFRVFKVADVMSDSRSRHSENVADLLRRFTSGIESANKQKREYNRIRSLREVAENRAAIIGYCKFFGLRAPKLANVPRINKKKLAVDNEWRKGWDARATERRAARYARMDEERREYHAKRLREDAERLAKMPGYIAEWRAGGDPPESFHGLPCMLRVITREQFTAGRQNDEETLSESKIVETSQGAFIPASHAVRALALVRSVVARGEEWKANGHTCKVGHYSISRIAPDGTIYAGCHVIPYSEVELVAPQLADVAPESEDAHS